MFNINANTQCYYYGWLVIYTTTMVAIIIPTRFVPLNCWGWAIPRQPWNLRRPRRRTVSDTGQGLHTLRRCRIPDTASTEVPIFGIHRQLWSAACWLAIIFFILWSWDFLRSSLDFLQSRSPPGQGWPIPTFMMQKAMRTASWQELFLAQQDSSFVLSLDWWCLTSWLRVSGLCWTQIQCEATTFQFSHPTFLVNSSCCENGQGHCCRLRDVSIHVYIVLIPST